MAEVEKMPGSDVASESQVAHQYRLRAENLMALALETNIFLKKKEFSKVPVLRNLVPAQVLAGKSSFNTGSSISAGLPVYARNQVKAMAAILDRKM